VVVDQNASLRELTIGILRNPGQTKDPELLGCASQGRLVEQEGRSACKCVPRTSDEVAHLANIRDYQTSRCADLYDELLSWVVIYEGFRIFSGGDAGSDSSCRPPWAELNFPVGINVTTTSEYTCNQVCIAGCCNSDPASRTNQDNRITRKKILS
jgi:hypothetical protein